MARKKKKSKRTWTKQTMRMKDNHTWDAPKGYKIFVIDRGAASFNIPQAWVIGKFEPLEINDVEPPDDNARLSVTVMNFPGNIDWSQLPLMHLFAESLKGSEQETDHEVLERKEIVRADRKDLEMLWTEHRFIDPIEKREAFSRITIARGSGVHILMTLDYWADDGEKMLPAWAEATRSLQLGRVIEDPRKGVTLH